MFFSLYSTIAYFARWISSWPIAFLKKRYSGFSTPSSCSRTPSPSHRERSQSLAAQAWCAGERLLGPHVPVADDSDDDQSSAGPDAATTETPVNLNQDAFIKRDPVAPGADRPLGGKIDAGVDSGVARSSPSRVSAPGMSPPPVGAAAAARRAADSFDLMEDWDDFFRRPADPAPAPAPSSAPTSGECGVCLGTGMNEQQGVLLVCRR